MYVSFFFSLHLSDSSSPLDSDRGEGANHAIVDVLDFSEFVTRTVLLDRQSQLSVVPDFQHLRRALDSYEQRVVSRTRPAVLASRQACLDAHDWAKINRDSPLLSRRRMMLDDQWE